MSVLTPIDFCHTWAIFGPLVDKNTRNGELVELPASDTWGLSFIRIRSLPLKSFLDFFLNVVPYQLESWFMHWVGCTTYWVHVSLEWDPCDLHVLSLGTVNSQAFTDAGKGRIRQSLTALVFLFFFFFFLSFKEMNLKMWSLWNVSHLVQAAIYWYVTNLMIF